MINSPLHLGLKDLVTLGAAVLVGSRAAAEHVNALLHGGAVEPRVPLAQAVDVTRAVL